MFEKGCELDRGALPLRGFWGSSWQELQILSPASFLCPGTGIYCYYPLLIQLLLVIRDAREAKASSSPFPSSPILPWSRWPNSSAHCCGQACCFCATSPGWLSNRLHLTGNPGDTHLRDNSMSHTRAISFSPNVC